MAGGGVGGDGGGVLGRITRSSGTPLHFDPDVPLGERPTVLHVKQIVITDGIVIVVARLSFNVCDRNAWLRGHAFGCLSPAG
jgi:hypothetical protein